MVCLNCDGENFKPEVRKIDQEVEGKNYSVKVEVMTCQNCDFILMTTAQADVLLKAVRKLQAKDKS